VMCLPVMFDPRRSYADGGDFGNGTTGSPNCR